ncbi:MAG: hypothetical protein JWM80_931 [Cyanobacteria bacterium RYN_339]|nr:hypothetical protein [Cyanobacteria bacterium RYN_339]
MLKPMLATLLLLAAPAPRTVPTFSAIDVAGGVTLEVHVGKPQRVALEGMDAAVAEYVTEVVKGVLMIHPKPKTQSWRDLLKNAPSVTARVDVPRLTSIKSAGACVVACDHLAGPTFTLTLAGASSGTVMGKVQQFNAHLSGASKMDAAMLKADQAAVDATGASHALVNAGTSLTADATGASDIAYLGKPKLTQKVSGAATVHAK